MKKFTLLIASLFITIGAMAQRPVLELTSGQIGTSYPYTLTDEDASKVFALEDLTVAVRINAPDALSGRMSLFATSAQDLAANSGAEGKNSRYVGYGLYNDKLAYLCGRGRDAALRRRDYARKITGGRLALKPRCTRGNVARLRALLAQKREKGLPDHKRFCKELFT